MILPWVVRAEVRRGPEGLGFLLVVRAIYCPPLVSLPVLTSRWEVVFTLELEPVRRITRYRAPKTQETQSYCMDTTAGVTSGVGVGACGVLRPFFLVAFEAAGSPRVGRVCLLGSPGHGHLYGLFTWGRL